MQTPACTPNSKKLKLRAREGSPCGYSRSPGALLGKAEWISRLRDLCGLLCQSTSCPHKATEMLLGKDIVHQHSCLTKPRGLGMVARSWVKVLLEGTEAACSVFPHSRVLSHSELTRGTNTGRMPKNKSISSAMSTPFNLLVCEPQCMNEEPKLRLVRSKVSLRLQTQVWLTP